MLISLGALLYLGWLPLVQRIALSEAKVIASTSCKSSIMNAPITSLMWDAFSSNVTRLLEYSNNNQSWMKFVDVKEAHIFLATPELEGIQIPGPPASGVNWKESTFYQSYQTFTPNNRRKTAVNAATGNEVPIVLNTTFKNAPVSPYLINDISKMGNTVICKIIYSPQIRLFGITIYDDNNHLRDVTAGFTALLFGANTSPPLPAPEVYGEEINPASLPGVSIAIAPQIERVNDTRFEPLQDSLDGLRDLNLAFYGETPIIQENSRNFGNLYLPSMSTKEDGISDRLESCLNPLALVRNAFLTALIEILARDGMFRRSTEIALVNSFVEGKNGNYITPPTIAVKKGSDITKQLFRLPYSLINFVGFKDQIYDYELNGVLSQQQSEPVTGLDEIRKITLAQLPHCTHLYSSQGRAFTSPYSESRETEPNTFNPQTQFSVTTSSMTWQYDGNTIPLVTASELVSHIGALRFCPYRSPNLHQLCNGSQNFELTPDIDGITQYWSNGIALDNPGILAPLPEDAVSIFHGQDTISKGNDFPILVLVSHKLTPYMVERIENWYKDYSPNSVGTIPSLRAIRFILFPYQAHEKTTTDPLLTRLNNENRFKPGLNFILSIEPCEKDESGFLIYPTHCEAAFDEDQKSYKPEALRIFWRDLLYDHDLRPNIYERALDFYRKYLITAVPIL